MLSNSEGDIVGEFQQNMRVLQYVIASLPDSDVNQISEEWVRKERIEAEKKTTIDFGLTPGAGTVADKLRRNGIGCNSIQEYDQILLLSLTDRNPNTGLWKRLLDHYSSPEQTEKINLEFANIPSSRSSEAKIADVEDDFDVVPIDVTDKEFIVDDEGKSLDSDFRAYRQGSHVVVHILSLGGSRGTGMRQGRVIAARRIRDSNLRLSAILTANAGQRIRNSNPPIIPTQSDCVVRKREYLQISDNEEDWCADLWRDAAPIASTGAHNFDRPLLFFFETELSPGEVLDIILHRRISFQPNTVPASPRGREAYSIDGETIQGGWVYVIRNHSWPGWLKIGKAAELEARMQSYRTYEPHEGATFEYLEAYQSEFALNIEQATHDYLSQKLARNENNSTRHGEWYWITKDEAINAIKENWIGEFPESA